jgi:hypothetical protein
MLSSKKIIELRNKYGYSQEDIASRLNMSRPTFAKIESGEKKINKIEEEKIREIFSFYEDIKDRADKNIRIDLPKKDIKKFKEILLYILEKVGAEPNVGMTVIYKLLYFIDFDYYEKYEKQIMGLTYFKNNFGPTPKEFVKVVEEMKSENEIMDVVSKYFTHEQKKFLPIKSPDLSKISAQELEMIDSVLARYGDKSASELSSLSHLDTP